jgi:hypothetical protein
MVFVEWWMVRKLLYGLILLALALAMVVWSRRRKSKTANFALVAAFPVGLFGLLFLAWFATARGANDYSAPIYSPRHDLAARINTGPFGATSVEIFRWYGLRNETVFVGSLVDDQDPRWVSENELQIFQTDAAEHCVRSAQVKVDCVLTHP